MPRLDLINETFVAAPQAELADALCDERAWSRWLPGLTLRCFEDRGSRGKRWTVSGALVGTAELWLEQVPAGTVVHAFLQADPAPARRGRGVSRARLERRYGHRLKAHIVAVKDGYDLARPAGTAPSLAATGHRPGGGGRVASGEQRTVVRGPDQEDHDGQPDDE